MADRLGLLAQAAARSMFGTQLGRAVEYHSRLASTQDRARELADGARHAVVADEQTAGRGTRDRTWDAPAGTSLLLSTADPGPPAASSVASLIAGVAVARAIAANDVTLKWPNDVLVRGRKVAGILTHVTTGPAGALIVGIGVNVHQRAEELPPRPRHPATSLALEGVRADRLVLLERILRELDRALAAPAEALHDWRERSSVLGRDVIVEQAGSAPVRGRASGLAEDGALVIETAYGPQRIVTGEVRVEG